MIGILTVLACFAAQSALGEVLSQHPQPFLSDTTGDVTRVARTVLSVLASGADEVRPVAADTGKALSAMHVEMGEELCTAAIDRDPAQFSKVLEKMRRAGCSADDLAFHWIPDTARALGVSWENDQISFADVTIGCARLQSALHRLPETPPVIPFAQRDLYHDCLVLVPAGAQHTLGALVLAKQLRQARQKVFVELEASLDGLASLAKRHHFDVVLISASVGECPEDLRLLVDGVRMQFTNCNVIVGGSISDLNTDALEAIGADHVTKDWQEALDLCI